MFICALARALFVFAVAVRICYRARAWILAYACLRTCEHECYRVNVPVYLCRCVRTFVGERVGACDYMCV